MDRDPCLAAPVVDQLEINRRDDHLFDREAQTRANGISSTIAGGVHFPEDIE